MTLWDEYKEPQSESSSDDLNLEDSSLDEPSSGEDSLAFDNKKGDNTHEGLEDYDGGGGGSKTAFSGEFEKMTRAVTFEGHYRSCLEKMDLDQEKIKYRTGE